MATGYSVMDALNKHTKAGVDDPTPKAKFQIGRASCRERVSS